MERSRESGGTPLRSRAQTRAVCLLVWSKGGLIWLVRPSHLNAGRLGLGRDGISIDYLWSQGLVTLVDFLGPGSRFRLRNIRSGYISLRESLDVKSVAVPFRSPARDQTHKLQYQLHTARCIFS